MSLYNCEIENLQEEIDYLKQIVKLQNFKIETFKNMNTELERKNKELEDDNQQLYGILTEMGYRESPF